MNRKSALIYAAGLLQGIALVAFPASSTILTDPHTYHFTKTQYGSLFIPQSLFSIVTALLNAEFCKYFGANRTLAIGLGANFSSMALLTLSVLMMDSRELAYGMLMVATSCLGIGFGMVVPTINRIAEELWPKKSNEAVLTLNAILGVGTTLAPVLIALFSAMSFWWGLPLSLTFALLALMLYNLGVDLSEEKTISAVNKGGMRSSGLICIFAAFAFLYGIIETINGNWIAIYMSKQLNASINLQSLALTSFWGMVTLGRIFFAMMSKFLSQQTAFQIAPFISTIAFIVIASQISAREYWSVVTFGLMGFGCSVLLPLLIGFGGKQLKSFSNSVPGIIISFYLLGYGVAAFGVGPLEEFGHLSLRAIYAVGAIISFVLGMLSLYIIHRKKNYN